MIQLRPRRSLLNQALAANLLCSGFSLLLLTLFFLATQKTSSTEQLRLRAQTLAAFLETQAQFPMLVGDRPELERLAESAVKNADVDFVEFRDQRYQVRRESPRKASVVEVTLPVQRPSEHRLAEWETAAPAKGTLGEVCVGFSTAAADELYLRSVMQAIGAAIFFLVVILGTQFLEMRRILRPMGNLIRSARQLGTGDLAHRAAIERRDEVGELAAAFNEMAGQLGETTVSKASVDNIIQCMGEALFVIERGRVRKANRAAEKLLGYAAEELTGLPYAVILGNQELQTEHGHESTLRARDGSAIPVLLGSDRLETESTDADEWVVVAADMTERKRAQEQLIFAKNAAEEASRAKSEFLANMSHELRTPLNAIIGYSEMLQEDGPGNWQETMEDLKRIEASGKRLLNLVNDVLDISKIEAGKMEVRREPFSVRSVVGEVVDTVQPLATKNRNRLVVDLTPEDVVLINDGQKFRQSLLNLVNNACKFTEAGEVRLSVKQQEVAGKDRLSVAISDTGVGMPAEKMHKLFDAFSQIDGSSTRKFEGTGLGLAISRRFCRMMGGDITVSSELGRGSVFTMWIPAEGSPPEDRS